MRLYPAEFSHSLLKLQFAVALGGKSAAGEPGNLLCGLRFGFRLLRVSRSIGCFEFAHRWSVQFQSIGVVDDAIQDGVGEAWFADDVMPLVDVELAGDESRAAAVAVFDDLHQIAALVGGEPIRSPVVEDQQVGLASSSPSASNKPVDCSTILALNDLSPVSFCSVIWCHIRYHIE
jgi:hypothetical protein